METIINQMIEAMKTNDNDDILMINLALQLIKLSKEETDWQNSRNATLNRDLEESRLSLAQKTDEITRYNSIIIALTKELNKSYKDAMQAQKDHKELLETIYAQVNPSISDFKELDQENDFCSSDQKRSTDDWFSELRHKHLMPNDADAFSLSSRGAGGHPLSSRGAGGYATSNRRTDDRSTSSRGAGGYPSSNRRTDDRSTSSRGAGGYSTSIRGVSGHSSNYDAGDYPSSNRGMSRNSSNWPEMPGHIHVSTGF